MAKTLHLPARLVFVGLFVLPLFSPLECRAFTGTEGAAFLELPVGARPAALGSAYSALAEDAYAPTWNPAGLAFLENAQVAGMHMEYVEDTAYEYASFAAPLGTGRGLGLSVQYFRPGAITGLDQNANPIGDINGSYGNYSVAFGQSLGENVGLGLTGSYIRASIDDVSAHAFAANAGLLYRPSTRWRWAFVVANAGERLKFISNADRLPLTYRLGGAYHPTPSWTIALEGTQLNGVTGAHGGLEYETPFGFSFRTGYDSERTRQLSTLAGMSFGLSMLAWGQDLSYTWLPLSDLGSGHLISLVIHFGPSRNESAQESHRLERPPKEEDEFKIDTP